MKERLFRIGKENDPYCNECFDQFGTSELCDIEHYLCTCVSVSLLWNGIKTVACNLLQIDVPNSDMISLLFPKCNYEAEMVWLLGSYFGLIWTSRFVKGSSIKSRAQLFGFLKFKYKRSQVGARVRLEARLLELLEQQA